MHAHSSWIFLVATLIICVPSLDARRGGRGKQGKDGADGKKGKKGEIVYGLKPEYNKMRENNKSEIDNHGSDEEINTSGEGRSRIQRNKPKFEMNPEQESKRHLSHDVNDGADTPSNIPEGDNDFDFTHEENELMKRVKEKMKVWDKTSEDDHEITTPLDGPDLPKSIEDTRERIRKILPQDSRDELDISYQVRQLENDTSPRHLEPINRPKRIRRNAEDFKKLYKHYKKAIKTTTEWQEWRNISGTMKRFPTIIANWVTRNKHYKIVQEAKRKMKKAEIIQRYNEKSQKLLRKYHKANQYTRGEINKVKGKIPKGKDIQNDNLFKEFLKPANTTLIHNLNNYRIQKYQATKLCDGMSGSNSELYYKDDNITKQLGLTQFDSDKTVESNYINETLIKNIGIKLTAKERKELNKNLKRYEVMEHETLAPHFYEDDRDDFFQNEEQILGQRATPLDPLDGLQLLPYVLREKTLPPMLQHDNTIEEVIRNCRHLDFENFRKLGAQKLPHYVLKVHDRRRRFKNITIRTTPKDDSVLSREDEKEFMKKITLKTEHGRLLYDHEKLYDKISRHKFKYKKVIYNDSLCWAYRELTDLAPVYVTIVPKKNLTSLGEAGEEDAFLLGHMFHLCSKLAFDLKMREGYRVVINNGYAGNHNLTHLNIMLIGGRQMRYPKYYDLSHFNSDKSAVEHDISTYGDNFELSGRMADFLGAYGPLKDKRAKWLSSKYPKMCEDSDPF